MKIVVYFENVHPAYAEEVAHFASEEVYKACLPKLEKLADEKNMIVTESVREDEWVGVMSKDERAEFDFYQRTGVMK